MGSILRASPAGQGHDKFDNMHMESLIPVEGEKSTPPPPAPRGDDVDISAGQKMVSAMSGSLLTSLLGMFVSYLSLATQISSAPGSATRKIANIRLATCSHTA
jgi:solute carrier family 25, member 39/40